MKFLHSLASRRRDEEQGFTLIELMVVVLIIAILIAIAIPTFLGARQRAQDRAAQSDLRNGLTAEKTTYTDTQTYSSVAATMTAIEPSLKWGAALTVVVGDAVVAGDAGTVCLSEASKSGKVFQLADVSAGGSAGTYYGKAAGGCPAAALGGANLAALGASW
ncbi:MAG TPA: prepilin-type N-terminal cleavage/methylation domain-containing protein [Acidimicrobiia bacterium]|nr:prepilin-type N-terminal cleavage/methylation domain-containing protein [Acidimicrobiia bacterium]